MNRPGVFRKDCKYWECYYSEASSNRISPHDGYEVREIPCEEYWERVIIRAKNELESLERRKGYGSTLYNDTWETLRAYHNKKCQS